MQHKLPDRIFGISTSEAYKKYLEESKKKETARAKPEQSTQPLEVKANINLSDYIKVPNTNVLISREIIHKGLNWENTHYALADNGLFIPSPGLFMPYFLNVRAAAHGKVILYDGNNNPIPRNEAEELWNYLSSTNRTRGDCWTWLDAMFKQGSGYNSLDIETDHRVAVKNGKKSLQGKVNPLEICIDEDCFVDLDFNKQGFPIRKSSNQKYVQEENIQYWYPKNGRVARFMADSGGAFLSCLVGPSLSYSSLGVFACAEGTPAKKIK